MPVKNEYGRLADREQLVARGEEATRPDEAVAVAEGDSEADGVIDEGADGEDQDVLAGDVRRVLHARQTGLQEGEARLHEHHEDRREDDPDRVRRDQEVLVTHRRSTSFSSFAPVLLWVTFSTVDRPDEPVAGFVAAARRVRDRLHDRVGELVLDDERRGALSAGTATRRCGRGIRA